MPNATEAILTPKAEDCLIEKYSTEHPVIMPVQGGYSRNRRAIVEVDGHSLFAKEVDVDLLPDEGFVELGWLKKDFEVVRELSRRGLSVAPEWAELDLHGHLLLLPSYKQADGWHWTLPEDKRLQTKYIQAVIDATKQLEKVALPEDVIESLSLQPFFRDEIAYYDGIEPILSDTELRSRLVERYRALERKGGYLSPVHSLMIETLQNDDALVHLKEQTLMLALLPNDCFNHCDVRSDNLTYNQHTGEVKFVDWNWASYAPAKFGATEFLLDMARRGVDISPWYEDMSIELLAAMVGYGMIRSLKPPLAPGSTLRDMQAETAAVANYLYGQLRDLIQTAQS